jgi:hypothetical protein
LVEFHRHGLMQKLLTKLCFVCVIGKGHHLMF